MRNMIRPAGLALLGVLVAGTAAISKDRDTTSAGEPVTHGQPGLKLENLLSAELERVEGTEVIVSRVAMPPRMSLPKHWHPGEEFAYVLEGSVTLWQKGRDDTVCKAGDVVKIPLRQVHTAITGEEGATVLVFRVHEKGKPERIPVE